MIRQCQLIIGMFCCYGISFNAWSAPEQRVDFETPSNAITWRAETTQPDTRPAEWVITADRTAPSPSRVLALRRINNHAPNVFNLYWTRDISFEDGILEVNIRADAGSIDQGGGLIWRARDQRNYYLARYNPLERNLRLYVVTDGARRQLADAPDLNIPSGRWWKLRIAHHGNQISAWLDDVRLLQATDDSLRGAGGVGVWAKADATSSFDDFAVKPQ